MTCKEITESFNILSQSATLNAHICMISIYCKTNKYSKPSLKWSNWGKRSSRLVKQQVDLKKRPRTQINGKCNDISSYDANKKIPL
jgi:hypothetical protein